MWAGRIPLGVCRFNKRGDVNDIVMASIFWVFANFFHARCRALIDLINSIQGSNDVH